MLQLLLLLITVSLVPAINLPQAMGDRFFGLHLSVGDSGDMDSSLFLARRTGSTVVTLDIAWDQVEDSAGNLKDPFSQIYYANIMYRYYPMKIIVIFPALDTDSSRIPKPLKAYAMNNPLVVSRYLRAAEFVLSGLPDVTVHAFAIGNETDNYLRKHPLLWPEYKAFYKQVADSLRADHPGLSIANKNTWFGLKYYNRTDILELNLASDLIFLNYYLLDTLLKAASPLEVHQVFDTACALFPDKPVYFSEYGCPSSDSFINSSEEIQRQFMVETFKAWDRHSSQVRCLYFFWLNDIRQADLDMFGQWYGNQADWFMAWLGSLGLRARDGRAKPAFSALEAEIGIRADPAVLPERRSFSMGFTPWPRDNTLEAVNQTYDSILANGDVVSEHIEQGIPWSECYSNAPFPAAFLNDLSWKKSYLASGGRNIFLSLTPLNLDRSGMAGNRGVSENEPLPAAWRNLAFNSDSVKKAFLNYSERMITEFNPAWVALGIEANLLRRNAPEQWEAFVELRRFVYDSLKARHPSLPVGVTLFSVPFFPQWSGDSLAVQTAALAELSLCSDFVAFSIYPYMSALACDSLPPDYVSHLFSLTTKPVAISECGYPAQTWTLGGNTFRGTQRKQNAFLNQALTACSNRSALFAVWYASCDYDSLWAHLLGRDSLSLIWRDAGLLDETANPRTAWYTWKAWMDLPGDRTLLEKNDVNGIPEGFAASPNPFNPATRFILPPLGKSEGRITLWSSQGRLIWDRIVKCDDRMVAWTGIDMTGRPAASGIYLARLTTDNRTFTRRLVLIR